MPYKPTSGGSRKPKKDEGRSFRGLLGNLVDDVAEAGAGLIPGIVNVGKAVGNDLGVASGLSRGSYQTDDIVNAIRRSYTDRGTVWGEFGRGNFQNSAKALYENPLGPILDVATIFTGGGAAAGKLGATAAKGGSQAGARLAGLEVGTLRPRSYTIQSSTGGSFTKPVRRNPVTRARGDAFEALSNRFPDARIVGANKRVGRRASKIEDRKKANEIATTQRRFRQALTAMRPGSLERRAVWVLAGGHNIASLKQMYAKRYRMLDEEIARKKTSGRKGESGDSIEQAEPLQIESGTRAIGPGPNPNAGTDMVLWQAPDGTPQMRKTRVDEDIANSDPDPDDFTELLAADRKESLARNERNKAFVAKRLAELDKLDKKGIVANPSARLLEAVEAAREMSDITTARLASLSRGRNPDVEAETAALATRQANRASLESRLMRALGVTDQVYGGAIRSHVKTIDDKLDTRSHRAGNPWSKPGKMAEAQYNSGYNFFNARDSTNPAIYLHTAQNVFEHASRIRRHAKMMDMGMHVSRIEAAAMVNSGKYRVVEPDAKIAKDMAEVYDLMIDAERVMGDTPGYAEILNSLERSVRRPDQSEDMVYLLPTKTYDEMAGDFQASSEFVRRWIDNPTRLWRALTLNLRPAWIVNGFVGNLFMLANAYGVRGLKNYVLNGSTRFSQKSRWVNESVPELTDMGWAHESQAGLKGLGSSWRNDPESRVKRAVGAAVAGPASFTRAMGTLNSWLADSAQRRAAMISAIDPYVKQYMRANPDVSWEDAAKKLWENDDFSSEMTQRVLDDMVDFGDLSVAERKYVKRAIPFIAWVKGASKVGINTTLNKPWNVAGGAALANVSNDQVREQYGEDASAFMLGQIDGPGDRILMTNALNPFMTPTDIFGMVAGTVLPNANRGSQNPLSQFNPVFKAPGEALARKDFFFGKELDREGERSLVGLTGQQAINSFAQKRLIDAIRNPNNDNPNRLYDQSTANALMNYLGVPVRTLANP